MEPAPWWNQSDCSQTANPIPCIHPAGISPEGPVAVAGGGGEEGFALVEGHEQQVALAGFVPEDALAVDPGGVALEAAENARPLSSGGCVNPYGD